MPLPHVQVILNADGTGKVAVNGEELTGVIGVQIVGQAGDIPQVRVTLRPGQVLADLSETGIQLVQSGPSAADFAEQLNPARLDGLALAHLEAAPGDMTMAEAFAAAVAQMADEYGQARG